jgi:anti-sigma regulatory factor (Ser/Thr protein kinase)
VRSSTSELRVPADRRYVVVAKRAAAGFASVAGLDVEALEDLVIAVSQAFENAVHLVDRAAGPGNGQIRLHFDLSEKGLDVHVRSTCSRSDLDAEAARRDAAPPAPVAAAAAVATHHHHEPHDLALRLMGLFVDDCRYRVDERTGGLRVRLTKYRVS